MLKDTVSWVSKITFDTLDKGITTISLHTSRYKSPQGGFQRQTKYESYSNKYEYNIFHK